MVMCDDQVERRRYALPMGTTDRRRLSKSFVIEKAVGVGDCLHRTTHRFIGSLEFQLSPSSFPRALGR